MKKSALDYEEIMMNATEMTPEEKLMKLFSLTHGDVGAKCHTEIVYDDDFTEPVGVNVFKGENHSRYVSRESLIFDYVTRDFTK